MEERINRRKFKIKAFDLESHNDDESIERQETAMWLSCYIDEKSKIDDPTTYQYSMDEVIDLWEKDVSVKGSKQCSRPCKNVCCYIWNASFEWSFILPVLIKRGFKFKEKIEKDDEYVFNSVTTKSCSSVWTANIKFSKRSGTFLIRDLCKIFPGSLREVAKSFNLPTQKGEIDYRLNRLHNHIVTDEEKEYCFNDTRIIIDILLIMQEKHDRDFWNSSSASTMSMKRMMKFGWPRFRKPYLKFRENYPLLSSEENEFLRHTVGGGITYAPPRYQFKELNCKIGHCDKHNMHPSSAYFNLFPYGEGEYFKGQPPLGRISAIRAKISYDDVYIHERIDLIGIDFITDREEYFWSFEIPTMRKCYKNLRIEYIDGYAYKMRPLPWKKYYAYNYNERLKAKAEHDQFNIMFYKLLNNSSYGKLLEKPHNEINENIINNLGIIDSVITDKPQEEWKNEAKYTYLPVGSCIPAYSRVDICEEALKYGEKGQGEYVVYIDTDSIFFIWNKFTENVWNNMNHKDFLGGWGWEEMIDRFQATAPKRYKEVVEGKTIVKAGGINFKNYMEEHHTNEVRFDEINIISSSWKVQRAYRVKGGTLIEFQTKEMSVQKKYLEIYNRNVKM